MKRLLIILGLVAIFGLAIFGFIQNRKFHLVKSDPANKSTTVPASQIITFYFNKELAAAESGITNSDEGRYNNLIEINPLVPGRIQIDGKKLIFKPGVQGFEDSITYKVKVSNIKSEQGEVLPDIVIEFTSKYVPFNQLSEAQQQQQINQTDQYLDTKTDRNKFINNLPYTTDGYSIEYIHSSDYFTIRITNSPVASQKTAALKYMSDRGVDPNRERIEYFVIKGLE
jgi:hypothetical protein